MAAFKRYRLILLVMAMMFVVVVVGQNCGDVKLRSTLQFQLRNVNQDLGVSYLPKPNFVAPHQRLIVLLDMSYSSIQGTCPGDMDYPQSSVPGDPKGDLPGPGPTPPPVPCGPGYDVNGIRFDWVTKWLDDLAPAETAGSDIKVYLYPFTSGRVGLNQKIFQITGARNWVSPSVAKLAVPQLAALQAEDLVPGSSAHNMGLTNFGLPLTDVDGLVTNYISQNSPDVVGKTKFDLAIVSDGVPRPREFDFYNAIGRCDYEYTRGLPLDSDCSWSNSASIGEWVSLDICNEWEDSTQTPCDTDWGTHGTDVFGDPRQNLPSYVLHTYSKTLGRALAAGMGRFNTHLLMPNMSTIPANERKVITDSDSIDPIINPDLNILRLFEYKLGLAVKTSTTSTPPVTFSSNFLSEGKSYRIVDFEVVNLNARIDKNGSLVVDSDADGISDDDEKANGSDPTVARSNGYCLDGVVAIGGCKMMDCNPHLDSDGDGLNNCEEDTLNLSSNWFTSFDDGIPDLYRVLYGDSMTKNNTTLDDSSDGITNKDAFMMGAVARADLSTVPAGQLVSVTRNYVGENSQHQPKYQLRIKNIPLVPTKAVTENFILNKSAGNPVTAAALGGTAHAAGINQIVILVHAVPTIGEPQGFWFVKRFDVNYNNPVLPPIDLSTFVPVDNL